MAKALGPGGKVRRRVFHYFLNNEKRFNTERAEIAYLLRRKSQKPCSRGPIDFRTKTERTNGNLGEAYFGFEPCNPIHIRSLYISA